MIPYSELRKKFTKWPKYSGCRTVQRAPLMTPGFPGSFNMSSTEHHWLKEYGGYVDWNHDYVFSTVQSCIRLNDFELLDTPAGWNYLGVFEMADLSGEIALARVGDYRDLYYWQMRELVRFLGELGIAANRIHPSYCTGGRVEDLTAGKYRFDYAIPEDVLSRDAFVAAGVPGKNLIPEATRDTLLSLHLHRPSPWGYRNEIYVETEREGKTVLVDVATSEYFLWRPLFSGGEDAARIVGLETSRNGALGIGCGVERLCMVANNLGRVHEVDYLRPFYEQWQLITGTGASGRDFLAGESLRALHRIHADMEFHPEAQVKHDSDGRRWLGGRRRKKASVLRRNIPMSVGCHDLERLLAEHSRTQPWHEHLPDAIEPTIRGIEAYRSSQARDLISIR